MSEKVLIVVVGPTAVGKTSTCIELANHFDSQIISADSRQFYQEMNLGTAKPNKEELFKAKHHFINSHSISENISAGSFEKMAMIKLTKLFATHDKLILTGGSGLYINAVTDGLSEMPKVEVSIRKELNQRIIDEGLESLTMQLKKLDPDYYTKVDLNNPQRVIRALEVCLSTGKRYSEFYIPTTKSRFFKVLKIGLNRSREELHERIDLRMDLMIDAGLFEEAEQLYQYKSHNALQTVGYKEIFEYMDGAYDREEAIRLLKRNSRRYAKRQMTWFNKDKSTKWFHPNNIEEIITYIESDRKGLA